MREPRRSRRRQSRYEGRKQGAAVTSGGSHDTGIKALASSHDSDSSTPRVLFTYADKLDTGLDLRVVLRTAMPSEGESPHLDIILLGQALPEYGILKWGLVAQQPHSELAIDRTLPHQTWWPDGTQRVPEWLEFGDVGTPFTALPQEMASAILGGTSEPAEGISIPIQLQDLSWVQGIWFTILDSPDASPETLLASASSGGIQWHVYLDSILAQPDAPPADADVECNAATTMQRIWRGRAARLAAQQRLQAITKLQAHWRGRSARRLFGQRQAAQIAQPSGQSQLCTTRLPVPMSAGSAIVQRPISTGAGGMEAIVDALLQQQMSSLPAQDLEDDAATSLQRIWRGRAARLAAQRRLRAILKLQAHWRGRSARVLFRQDQDAQVNHSQLCTTRLHASLSATSAIMQRQMSGPIVPFQGCFLPATTRASPGCRLNRGTAEVTTVTVLSAHSAGRDASRAPEGHEQLSSFMGGGSAILATITATGAIHSAYHLTSAAGPILEARPLHPQMLSQMLQQLWPAACESAPLPISGFMAPTGSFLAPIGSFLAATVVAAAAVPLLLRPAAWCAWPSVALLPSGKEIFQPKPAIASGNGVLTFALTVIAGPPVGSVLGRIGLLTPSTRHALLITSGTTSPVQRLASPYGIPAAVEELDLDDEDSSEDEPAGGDDLQEAPLQELQGQDGGAQDAVSEQQAIKTLAGAVVCVSVAAADTCLSMAGRITGLGNGPAQRFRRSLRWGYWLAGAGAGVAAAGRALLTASP